MGLSFWSSLGFERKVVGVSRLMPTSQKFLDIVLLMSLPSSNLGPKLSVAFPERLEDASPPKIYGHSLRAFGASGVRCANFFRQTLPLLPLFYPQLAKCLGKERTLHPS